MASFAKLSFAIIAGTQPPSARLAFQRNASGKKSREYREFRLARRLVCVPPSIIAIASPSHLRKVCRLNPLSSITYKLKPRRASGRTGLDIPIFTRQHDRNSLLEVSTTSKRMSIKARLGLFLERIPYLSLDAPDSRPPHRFSQRNLFRR